ncbi:MAG: bifunctional N-acetylglucosamine-1-phosphate uridyltransferase/glucosamine-1-phosphate acetyltransferase [Candidatus Margulisiibacteriota bacterium]
MITSLKAVILAAGKGTRMKSEILKVAHEVAGKPIVSYVLDTVQHLGVEEVFMVVGHQADLIQKNLKQKHLTFVMQDEQLGTGHAVMQVEPHVQHQDKTSLLILAGDCPLIEESTLKSLVEFHHETNAAATVLTTKMDNPGSYGRILRGKLGTLNGIREAKDCSPAEKKVKEINTGVYIFQAEALFKALGKIDTNNTQKEYYLTDVIHILKTEGKPVSAYCTDKPDQAIGVNTRMDLAKINKLLYRNNNQYFMEEGVTIVDPESTFIDSTVHIGHDTIINPFTVIKGSTSIGAHCHVGPHAHIEDATLGNGSIIPPFSHINGHASPSC